jgi:hypothetical protein
MNLFFDPQKNIVSGSGFVITKIVIQRYYINGNARRQDLDGVRCGVATDIEVFRRLSFVIEI